MATMGSAGDTKATSAAPPMTAENARYSYDEEALKKLKSEAPWMKNAKYFSSVAIGPTAVMKIMMHCQSGVDKGIAKGGNPIEVMGLLFGRPDPTTPKTLVVTDAFPLPIEGFETRVVADDENVSNHMIALGDLLENTRKERFMGWYHSHPFDLGDHSHCFLSQTDLSTQLQWQRAEDPHGNPFVAIVVDPLRSVHTGTPELKAFRAYPPEYNSPVTNECPDGSVEAMEQQRLELWGSCWNRYYELNVEYFMSRTSRQLLGSLTQDYLWISTLTNQPQSKLTEKLTAAKKNFGTAAAMPVSSDQSRGGGSGMMGFGRDLDGGIGSGSGSGSTSSDGKATSANMLRTSAAAAPLYPLSARSQEWNKAVNHLNEVTTEQLAESTLLETKRNVFS